MEQVILLLYLVEYVCIAYAQTQDDTTPSISHVHIRSCIIPCFFVATFSLGTNLNIETNGKALKDILCDLETREKQRMEQLERDIPLMKHVTQETTTKKHKVKYSNSMDV